MPPVDVQNRLLRVPDTELALTLLYMDDADRNRILRATGTAKGRRVREALHRHEHTRILYAYYEQACLAVCAQLEDRLGGSSGGSGSRSRSGIRTYYRPRR